MYELSILTDFSSAHHLKNYRGKCCQLHGHNWQVQVTIQGDKLDSLGMVMDFGVLKSEVGCIIASLDHRLLNELEPFRQMNPTSENIARYICETLSARPAFACGITVHSVKVWESPRSSVLYRP